MDQFDSIAKALGMIDKARRHPYQPSPRMQRAILLREAIYAMQPGKVPPAAQMTLLIYDALKEEAELASTKTLGMDGEHP